MKASAVKFAARPSAAVVALASALVFAGSASAQTAQPTSSSSIAPLSTAAPALAGTQEVDVYIGGFFGDGLSDSSTFGDPELDDDVVVGLRYGYNFTNNWGIELSGGYSPNVVPNTFRGDIDFDIYTVDVNAVYHFTTGTRFVPYITAGVGWVWGDLEHSIPAAGASTSSLSDDDSFSANAGIGVKYFMTDNLIFRVDGRYRYIDGLLDEHEDSLDTFETTFGVGWVF